MADYDPHARDKRESQLHKRGKEAEKFIASVDWQLLFDQYEWLTNQQHTALCLIPEEKEYYQDMTYSFADTAMQSAGLLHLLEGLKDLAVDHFGVPATTVLGKEEE